MMNATTSHAHGHEQHHHHHHHHEEQSRTIDGRYLNGTLNARVHEQAAVASAMLDINDSAGLPFEYIVTVMERIARLSEDAGGIVGHIKARITNGRQMGHASVVDTANPAVVEGSLPEVLDSSFSIELAAIILLLDPTTLAALCCKALDAE